VRKKSRFAVIKAAKIPRVLFALAILALLSSCARPPADLSEREVLYQAPPPTHSKRLHTPTFLIKNDEEAYNRIGTPRVRTQADEKVEVYVDPDTAALFFETQKFTTPRGTYRNLLYRIHFEKVPFALDTWHLTAGNNPGLLIIYTLDANDQLLLVTTVHTCGCFLAFLPTNAMPEEWFPADWPTQLQSIYGQSLPSRLQPNQAEDMEEIVFTLESDTHRISDVALREHDSLQQVYASREMTIFPMADLYQLPYKDGTESFFEMDGPRAGYVRNNTKFLEWLLISWWAFDRYVGQDKAYGTADTSDTIFYTSLKFWARKASDLKDFPGFLAYWGWKL